MQTTDADETAPFPVTDARADDVPYNHDGAATTPNNNGIVGVTHRSTTHAIFR